MENPLTRRQFTAGAVSVCLAGRAVAAGGQFEIGSWGFISELQRGDIWDADFDVRNDGVERGTTDVRLYFEGVDSVLSEEVTLNPEETENVFFEIDTASLDLGTHDCRVETGDASRSFEVTIVRPATFHLSDVTLSDATVPQGDSVTVYGFVENVGDGGELPVECFLDGDYRGGYEPALDSSETDDFSFTVTTDDLTAGEYELAVQTPDDTETRTLTVTQPTHFEINEWAPPTEPVLRGAQVTVPVTVENTANGYGRTTVRLLVDDEHRDEQTTPLAPSAERTVDLGFGTDGLSPGTHDISIRTDHAGVGRSFTVAKPAGFDVIDWTPPTVVSPEETVAVDVTVENVGGVRGETDVGLRVDGTKRDEESVLLADGSSDTVTLWFTPNRGSAGEHEIAVETEHDRQQETFTVREAADFLVANVESSSDDVPTDGGFAVVSDVWNDGGTHGERTVVLAIDGERVDDKQISLSAGATTPVEFSVDVDSHGLGVSTHDISVSVGDSSDQTEIYVYRPTTAPATEANPAEQSAGDQSEPTERPVSTDAGVDETDVAKATTERALAADEQRATVEPTNSDEPLLPEVPRYLQWAAAISSVTGFTVLGLRQMETD